MIILEIIMMLVFIKVLGFVFRLGWNVMKWVFGLFGWLIVAGLVISFAGAVFLPMIVFISLIVLACGAARRI